MLGIKSIEQSDDRSLRVVWTDSREDTFDVVELRRLCPCAKCVDEASGKRTLKPEQVADTVRPVDIHSVGQYAMNIRFTDGHTTGIYSFQTLREIAQQASVH